MERCDVQHGESKTVDETALPTDGLHMLAADLLCVEVPQQPVIIRDKAIQLAVPLLRQTLVELLDKRQERPLGWKLLLMAINRNLRMPAKLFSVTRKPEAVEKVFATHERDVPQAWNATRILFDRN